MTVILKVISDGTCNGGEKMENQCNVYRIARIFVGNYKHKFGGLAIYFHDRQIKLCQCICFLHNIIIHNKAILYQTA